VSEQLLKEILGELKALNHRVGNIEQRVGNMEQRIGDLEQGQQELAGHMERMETRINKLDSRLNRLELRIEEEIIDKIRALFDGYNLRGDEIENLRKHLDERLDAIALDINYLVRKTAQQEFVIQELRRAK
jgi:chromosome segregation ATPase